MTIISKINADGGFVNNDFTKRLEITFSDKADPWRMINKGLNIEATCTTLGCKAHTKRVWTILKNENDKYFGSINFLQRIRNIVCPICKQPESTPRETVYGVGFYNCNYSFEGFKPTEGKKVISGNTSSIEEQANVKNGFVKYEGSNISVFWEYLQTEVKLLTE